MNDSVFPRTSILGVRVDIVDWDELVRYAISTVEARDKAIISNVNVHAVNIAYQNEWFRRFINTSQVVFCDGFGVKWAAQFLVGRQLHRLTPPDWFRLLAEECARRGISMFFLGSRPAVVEKAGAALSRDIPNLRIVGVQHGYFDKCVSSSENQEIVDRINSLQPDVLMVGFGMPLQEKWIADNWDRLHVHVVFPVGAFFDYVSGEIRRAPRWMTEHGLEWLGRLVIEPRRLWRRYLLGNPMFLWRVLMQRFGLLHLQ